VLAEMKGARTRHVILAALLCLAPRWALSADNEALASAEELSKAFAQAAQRVIRSVVNISTTTVVPGRRPPIADFFPLPKELLQMLAEPPQQVHSLGSGVIITANGHIVTNAHVVGNATRIEVGTIDGQVVEAQVAGTDAASDLAVIRADVTGLPPAVWGDSEKLEIGEWVLAIGSPHGLKHSVTAGIISAKGRTETAISSYEDFIQTDAAINPGNSGGALANLRGEVVGINTAIVSSTGGYEGIGFAIPSNAAARICELLIASGKVVRGYLGIVPAAVTPRMARRLGLEAAEGVLVRAIYQNGPAHLANLLPGDVILAFASQKIRDVAGLARLVAGAPIGKAVDVVAWRDGRSFVAKPVIQERPAQLAGEVWFGI
jgi:serine protease Do